MGTRDKAVAILAERQHGVFSRRQALACGLTTDEIDGRLRRRRWVRIHAGVYRVAGSASAIEQKVLAAVMAAGDGACASHQTAGLLWRFEGIKDGPVHITVPGRRRVRVPGVAIHRPVLTPTKDVTRLGVIPITVPVRTILDLAGRLDVNHLEDVLDDALRRELVDPGTLLKRVRAVPSNGRRGLPALESLLRARSGKPIAGSALENRFRRMVRAAGLPEPLPQYEIRTPDGTFVARVDFAYPEALLAIEIDGYRYHSGRKDWEGDLVRQNRLVELGWVPLRITHRQISDRPDEVVRVVLTALSGSRVGFRRSARFIDPVPVAPAGSGSRSR